MTVPNAPTAVTPTAGDAQVSLTWLAPSYNGGSVLTDYDIEYAVSPPGTSWTSFSHTGTATSATVTGLTNGTAYIFRVAAVNAVGTSAWSSSSGAVTPVAPTAPTAPTLVSATPGDGQVALVWSAPSSNGGSAITGYLVEKSPNGSTSWTTVTTTGVVLTHTATGLSNGTIQYFRVSAINAVGTGTASNVLSATPSLVYPVVATTGGEVGTNITASQAISPMPTGITAGDLLLAFGALDNPTTAVLAASGWTELFTIANPTSPPVRLSCWGKIAAGGDTLTVTTAPTSSQDYVVTILRITGHAVTDLLWSIKKATMFSSASGNADPPSLDATMSQGWEWLSVAAVDMTNAADAVTAVPTNYTLVGTHQKSAASTSSVGLSVARRDLVAQTENPGTFTNTSRAFVAATLAIPSTTVPAAVPGTPTGLTPTAGDTQVSLSWTAPASNGSALTNYSVQWRTTAGPGSWNTFAHGSTATTSTVTGLTNGTGYDFQVAAINAVGTGSYTSPVSATPVSAPAVLDTFDRADTTRVALGGVGLGSNWVVGNQGGGGDQYHISSNSAVCDATFAAGTTVWNTAMGSTNHEVSARVAITANAGGGAWLIGRMPTSRDTTGYAVVLFGGGWGPSAGDLGVYIFRLASEVETQIAGPYLLGAATGEWDLKLTIVGSTIKAYVDGVERLSVTDATHTTGTRVAFRAHQNSALQHLFRWFDAKVI